MCRHALSRYPIRQPRITFPALWYFPVLMVLSGVAMVIFDSRIVHRYLRKMQDRVRRGQREPQLELGNQIPPQESTSQDEQPEILSVDPNGTNASASGVSPQQITVSDQEEQIPSIDTVP